MQSTSWLNWWIYLAWGRDIHLALDLNEELMEGNDVDDQRTPTVKLPRAYEYAQLLSILR